MGTQLGTQCCKCNNDVIAQSETLGKHESSPRIDEEMDKPSQHDFYSDSKFASYFDSKLVSTLPFFFKANQGLGATFADLQIPELGNVLVLRTLKAPSVLALTSDGHSGMCCGDVILAINGKHEEDIPLGEHLRQLKSTGGALEITVLTRPMSFPVQLRRVDKEKLGMVLTVRGDVLEISRLLDQGSILAWNETNWMKQVVVHDKVWSVDGERNTASDMLRGIQDSWENQSALTLVINKFSSTKLP
eukprot:TRINITY_DN67434_c0_g1_i1.p1 TRINITY_DN67434_c0_g1~~TRINITY_DN67434_c0_g1_i1.p1  ORF type:complete len:246 (-),score=27.48 TRINITY_DN67434_c0_g1_i1:440-1177(-)